MWDGGLLLFPTDTGKLVWWSTSGEKVAEVKVLEQDYYVRLAWDAPQRTLFVCGFTTLSHVTLQRESSSGTLGHMQIHPHTCTCTHAHAHTHAHMHTCMHTHMRTHMHTRMHAHTHAHTHARIHHHHIIRVNVGGAGTYVCTPVGSTCSGKVEGAHTTMFSRDGGRVEGVVRGFQIACCGLEFSPTSKHIAVGDLAGTIWVCPVNEDVPVASANVSTE